MAGIWVSVNDSFMKEPVISKIPGRAVITAMASKYREEKNATKLDFSYLVRGGGKRVEIDNHLGLC